MPQKLHHQKRAYYSCTRDGPDLLLFPADISKKRQNFTSRRQKTRGVQDIRKFCTKKSEKNFRQKRRAWRIAEKREGKRRAPSGVRLEQKQLPRLLRGLLPVHTPSSCDAVSAQCPPSPRIGTSSKGGRIQIPKPDGLSIRTSNRIQISQPCLPLDQDLGPDPDFPNLPASGSGPWAGSRIPNILASRS
jgi:hypothetical protein